MQPNTAAAIASRIREKLDGLLLEETKCHIHRVHGHLRIQNPSAYEPQILAIGPYHHGKLGTKLMEKYKLRYLKSLLRDQSVDPYVLVIDNIKHDALLCYPDSMGNFTIVEFAEMMLLDGCFILEFLRKCQDKNLRQADDSIFETQWMLHSIKRDLMLFENQIPFDVLCKLFTLVEGSRSSSWMLLDLISGFFGDMIRGDGYRMLPDPTCPDDVKHLLHRMHIFWSPPDSLAARQIPVDENLDSLCSKSLRFVTSVTKLRNVNVEFEKNDDQAVSLFSITFKKGTLKLSLLRIDDETDSLFRNLIAYEQYFPKREQHNFATDYMRFLDCIIDSPGDVEILCERGILDNWLDSDEAVSNMVNKLTDSVTVRDFLYAGVCDDVKKHCEKRRNKWMAKLRRNRRAILKGVAALVL